MQGSKSAFFAKSEKRSRLDDGFKRSQNSKKFVDRNKIARQEGNKYQKPERT